MTELFSALRRELDSGASATIVTVIESHGSTPRGAGARMLVGEAGYITGTIGGGAIEYSAIRLAQQALADGATFVREFSLTNDDAAELGMVCGGSMTLLFQCVTQGSASLISEIIEAAKCPCERYLETDILTGAMRINSARSERDWLFVEQLSALGTVYIFGGGHVAKALVPVLSGVEFQCVVLDDRPEFATPALFPAAKSVRVVDFGRLELSITPNDYIVIMTRGHLNDLSALMFALKTDAKYVGMMGSSKKRAAVYQAVIDHGFDRSVFARIHSPIGLKIKAETPAEIAISIAAELILARKGD